ncbi:MAG: bifunctional DNA-formamidopyrimidine glycosylase/DNA-(apurinic or apyrimidinic site) lyase [Bacillota bacterium]
MPELPEVETIKRSLAPRLLGRSILEADVRLRKMVEGMEPAELRRRLLGQVIGGLDRRGKYLLLELAAGDRVAFHLRMTGRLLLRPAGPAEEPHTYLVFRLAGGEDLVYIDPRKFGRLYYLPAGEELPPPLAMLGPEPLGADFTPSLLAGILAGRRGAIKPTLLDQRLLAGIGNIYADEILHRAGVHPTRPAGGLKEEEVLRLHGAMRAVLTEAICYRGTSKRDYVDGEGRPGDYQERLAVYGRAGEPCLACGHPIRRIVVGGRGTYFCPACQV